jgi:transcriptional enhancer factor
VKPPYGAPGYGLDTKPPTSMNSEMTPSWQGRSIAGPKLRLVEFSAYLEQQRDGDQVLYC